MSIFISFISGNNPEANLALRQPFVLPEKLLQPRPVGLKRSVWRHARRRKSQRNRVPKLIEPCGVRQRANQEEAPSFVALEFARERWIDNGGLLAALRLRPTRALRDPPGFHTEWHC